MLYNVIGRFVRSFFQLFYKRIYISGLENIPKDKPVFLAGNHSNALIDPMVVAIFLMGYRSSYFLGKAGIFVNGFLNWLFTTVHILPIYRPRDGADYAEKNLTTFERVDNLLIQKQVILIFPEGNCFKEKRLRPLKKGTVRMAFSAWEKGADVHIVPMGINYTKHDGARSELMLSFGKSMRVEDYRPKFEKNPAETYDLANENLSKGIKAEMIFIEATESEELIEQMLEIGRNNFKENHFFIMSKNRQRLTYEQAIANKINDLQANNKPAFENLKTKANAYFNALKMEKTTDKAVVNYEKPTNFWVLLLIPFATLFGSIFHFPLKYFKPMAAKMSAKDDTMFMTFWTGFLMGFYLVFGLLLMVIGAISIGFLKAFLLGLTIVFLTYFSGLILEKRKTDKANSALKKVAMVSPEKVEILKKMRKALVCALSIKY